MNRKKMILNQIANLQEGDGDIDSDKGKNGHEFSITIDVEGNVTTRPGLQMKMEMK